MVFSKPQRMPIRRLAQVSRHSIASIPSCINLYLSPPFLRLWHPCTGFNWIMDVVSVTASLTALVTLAIQSTKVISQAVQQIRGGPVHVQHLATKADALHQTLQQLSAFINEADLTSCSDVSRLFTNLQRLVEACAEDLKTLTRKLRCLQEAIGGNHVRRAWAVLKALLGEKELEHMWKVLQSHRETLNSQLIIIST